MKGKPSYISFNDNLRQIIRQEIRLFLKEQSASKKNDVDSKAVSQHLSQKFTPKISWLIGEERLQLLYGDLIRYAFIVCPYPEFKAHFFGSEVVAGKILWTGRAKHLIYLFDLLTSRNAIHDGENLPTLMCENFTGKDGDFTPKILGSQINNARNNNQYHFLDEIAKKVTAK